MLSGMKKKEIEQGLEMQKSGMEGKYEIEQGLETEMSGMDEK